ncbi:cytochrome-c oxidase, cbb3-type subunit III [Gallaecimonas sp. GXIMD4217]|uniref:cytochrome-c oxidase, cbb3-type subunit III n=1 Tax=Gallaecimonas sp. GXIMD4217 TaxID=3131927 RepID=UPI00311AD673
MSSFWSIWVTVITLGTIAGCGVLLWWCRKNTADVAEGELMHHSFDGIVEINNPLPKWWSYMFWATIVFSLGYLLLMPGLGNFKGLLGWTSANQSIMSLEDSRQQAQAARESGSLVQYDREMVKADETFGPIFAEYAKKPIAELAYDSEAVKVGQRLFLQNCAQCHGSDAGGADGFPNLTDNDWLYGGSPAAIKETILHGRTAAMPSWEAALGDQGIEEMTAYVLSLSGRKVDDQQAAAGKAKFALCAACHGADGKGSIANGLPVAAGGAPDLTDNIWLYGGSKGAVADTLRHGRNGVMPAWKDILGEDKVHVLAAYVYRLSNPEQKAKGEAAE